MRSVCSYDMKPQTRAMPCGGLERRLDKPSSKDPEQLNYGDFHGETFRRAFSKHFH